MRGCKATVSIIMLTYNQLRFTKRCIKSITEFTTIPYELILIDNGSRDGTRDYLKSLGHENLSFQCVAIRVICNKENLGYAKGCNKGIKLSKSKFIVLLNNDTIVTQNWLKNLIEVAKKDKKIGMVGPITCWPLSQQGVIANYSDIKEMRQFAQRMYKFNGTNFKKVPYLMGLCLLIKREVVNKIGLLDEHFKIGAFEDFDYCFRAVEAGFELVRAEGVYIHHFGGRTFWGNKMNPWYYAKRNEGLLRKKWQNKFAQFIPHFEQNKFGHYIVNLKSPLSQSWK